MCADFYYYLNRQGLQGRDGAKGEKGEPGNTPTFRTGVNTPTVYTLIVDSGDGVTFETGNLKYPMRDDGGDYLRYDRDDATVVLGNPNYADLQGNVGEVKLAGVTDHEENTAEDTDAVSYELFEANNEDLDTRMDGIDGEIERVDGRVTREIQDRGDADTALSDRIYLLDTNKANKSEVYTKTQTDNLLAGKANTQHTHTLSQITNAGTFAAKNSLDYNSVELTNKPVLGNLASKNTVDYQTEVTNKPTIPTVGDGTITITQGGVTKGTFTTNQSANSTIELDAGGGSNLDTAAPIYIDNNTIKLHYDSGEGLYLKGQSLAVRVDGTSVVMNNGVLSAPGPDLSNYVTNTSLANTLLDYPTNTALSNLVDYVTDTSQTIRYIPLAAAQITPENPVTGGPEVTIGTVDTGVSYEINVNPKYTESGYSFYSFGLGFKYLQDPTKFVALKGSELNVVSSPIVGNHTLTWRIYGISESLGYIIATQSSATAGIYFDDNTGSFVIPNDVYVINISITLQVDPSETFNTTDTLLYCVARYNSEEGYSYLVDESTVTTTKAVVADTAVDGSTITVNSSGQLQANIPVVPTVNDATITITQGGVTKGTFTTNQGIAGTIALDAGPDMSGYYTKTEVDNGFIANDIVQYPLEYLPDTTEGLITQNISDITAPATNLNGYCYYSGNNNNIALWDGTQDVTFASNPSSVNLSNLKWVEKPLAGGVNFIASLFTGTDTISSGNSTVGYFLGYYNNNVFVPTAAISYVADSYNRRVFINILNGQSFYVGGWAMGINTVCGLRKPVGTVSATLLFCGDSAKQINTVNLSAQDSSLLDLTTHIRVMALNRTTRATSTLSPDYKVVNLNSDWTSKTYSEIQTLFNSGDNLFDSHPASLSLKYDSTTLGVNANNELYAQAYTLPTASTSTLGGVKVDGSTITIDGNGVISSSGGGGSNINIDEASLSTEDFVVEGSPTITRSNGDIIITSSSWDDYARSTNNVDINNNVFEVKTAIKPTINLSSSDNILAQRESTNVYGWSIYQTTTGLGFWINKDGNNTTTREFTYSFTPDTKYYIKLTGDGSEIAMYVKSENDSDYTKIGSFGTNYSLSFTNGPTPIRTCYLSGQQYISDTSISKNGIMIYQGVIPFDTLTKATTSQFGLVKIDGSTITMNANGVISAAGSAPSNMVTTDTNQNISGVKTFRVTDTDYTPTLKLRGYSDTGNNIDFIRLSSNDYMYPSGISIGYAFNSPVIQLFAGTSGGYSTFIAHNGIYRNGSDTFTFWKDYAKNSKIILKNYQDIIIDSSMFDGTTIQYNSTSGKVEVIGGGGGGSIIKKTITQASANISESSGTVTVTDADVTTSTLVTLYPSDTTTETWLANNLASNIITEGSGSFTFTINGTLPSTFSMYYTIQEVS